MKVVLWIVVLAALAVLALQLWLRAYPHDFASWHTPVAAPEGEDVFLVRSNGATAVLTVGADGEAALARLDEVIRATPRTVVVAGSLEEGRVTYATRTAFWGFPDITTVELSGDRLVIRARQWIGGYDWGVNRARISGWLEQTGLPVPTEDTTSP